MILKYQVLSSNLPLEPRANGMEAEWEVLPKLSLPARLWPLTLNYPTYLWLPLLAIHSFPESNARIVLTCKMIYHFMPNN